MNRLLITSFALLILLLTGCVSHHNIRSGGLNVVNTQLPNNHLMYSEISTDEIDYSTVFGIRQGDKKMVPTQTTIVNYNGSNTNSMSANLKPIQIVSFILSSAAIFLPFGGVLSGIEEFVLAGVGSLLIGGTINESVWSKYHASNSLGEVNDLLIKQNSDIDYYINPTYNISIHSGPFNSTRTISGKAIGIEISDSLFKEKIESSRLDYSFEDINTDQVVSEDFGVETENRFYSSDADAAGLYFPNKIGGSVTFQMLMIAFIDGEKKILIAYERGSKEIVEIWVDPWSDRLIWEDEKAKQEVIDF